jgi:hypothetical protein
MDELVRLHGHDPIAQSVYDRVREIARRALAGGPRP